jgi:hypothetical protein
LQFALRVTPEAFEAIDVDLAERARTTESLPVIDAQVRRLVARCPLEKSPERFPVDARGDEQRGAGEEAEEVASREFVRG